MSRKSLLLSLLVSLVVTISSTVSHAGWIENGDSISVSADDYYTNIVSDGAGGATVIWVSGSGVYAQRIDGSGNKYWMAGDVVLCSLFNGKGIPSSIPDGTGGAIIAWADARNGGGDWDIFAQRVDGDGNVLWETNGLPIYGGVGNASWPVVVPDGSGGAIITWQDPRQANDIYAQRVDAAGDTLWTLDGVPVCADPQNQYQPAAISDGAGGAYIVWQDRRAGGTNWDLYAQRIDGTGAPFWAINGLQVCNDPFQQDSPVIVTDGEGGALVAWEDQRAGNGDIYGQRLFPTSGWTMWGNTGAAICTEGSSTQIDPLVVSDGEGGMIVAWQDDRSPIGNGNYDLYAQRINANGLNQWATDGVAVTLEPGIDDDDIPGPPVSDGAGGMIIAWADWRSVTFDADIYAQRIDRDGNVRWDTNGSPVCTAPYGQEYPELILTDDGDAIVAWADSRDQGSTSKIYGQRLEIHRGNWGFVAGEIASVADVAADQGGQVLIEWTASRLDEFENRTVTHYSVWRAVNPIGAAPATARGSFVDLSEVDRDFDGVAYRVDALGASDYYWEWLGNVDAMHFPGYAMSAPTLNDSVGGNPAWHYFQVVTHTSDPHAYWASAPDSGYSVDNLAPATPQNMAGYWDDGTGEMAIWWSPNTELDLSHYCLYRDAGPDFVPSDLNRIATTPDTAVTGLNYTPVPPWHYKVSAVDVHQNESLFATLAPDDIQSPALLATFGAAWNEGAVVVSWKLTDVTGTLSFQVHRRLAGESQYHPLDVTIDQNADEYSFQDDSVARGSSYNYRVLIEEDGVVAAAFDVDAKVPGARLALQQNYPNPFALETTIGFEVPEASEIELVLYDTRGRRVATLWRGNKDAGFYEVPFSADKLASGVYYYKLKAGKNTLVRKMVILR
jgi:hypothetical protein